ncbi:MAG: magnesium transporter [Fimbriimonadaceae bacterium]
MRAPLPLWRTDLRPSLARLRSLARLANRDAVRRELRSIPPPDLAELFQRLKKQEALTLLRLLDDETASYVLVELPTEFARDLIEDLPDRTLAHYLDILPMDDALDLYDDLGAERFEMLLEVIPTEDAEEIRRLLAYPKNSAGRLMTEDFFAIPPHLTMSQVLDEIRRADPSRYETVNDIYVLDEDQHLLGTMSLREVLRAPAHRQARDVMHSEIVTANLADRAEDVARDIARYDLYAMPILDDRGRMVGILTVDDAQDIVQEADTEDVLKLGAVSGDADSYMSLGVFDLVRRRIWWLMALFVAETFTGQVLRHYGQGDDGELTLNPVTYFIPLLIGAGGNSGSQVTTTITRALAVGDVRISDALIVMRKELATALMIGTTLGLIGFGRALAWGTDWHLCLVVGMALPLIVIWAAVIGSVLPLAAKRVGIDPAVMSAPFITTFVDATGLIIYFEIARTVLGPRFGM